MIWPAQLGLLLGSGGRADPESVVRFGYFLGVAFQIEDDLRNLSVDPGYGKEMNGDLFEAKRTLMLIHVRKASSTPERERLDVFLGQPREERSADEVLWLAALMQRLGSIDHARSVAAALAGAASHEFTLAYGGLPDSTDRSFIAGLVPWIFARP
jgi:geranylgeranyl diphosphate synthase type II